MAVRLHLTHIPELDQLVALEYGRVDEGLPAECVRCVGAQIEYVRDERTGMDVGFKGHEFSTVDVDAHDHRAIRGPPRFDVPMPGLTGASPGEITVGARAFFADRASIGHTSFALAAAEPDGDDALEPWRCCLEAGEGVAHYASAHALPARPLPRGLRPAAPLHDPRARAHVDVVPVRPGGRRARSSRGGRGRVPAGGLDRGGRRSTSSSTGRSSRGSDGTSTPNWSRT